MSDRAPSIDDLIRELGAGLRPVRRLAPPTLRALGWLALVAATAAVLAVFADLRAVGSRLQATPDMALAVLGSVATMVLGAIAAFELSLPDRRGLWALLPLPALALWVGASGMGCLRAWDIPAMHPASMQEAHDCFGFILGLSIPLSLVMIVMIRQACPLRPELTAATAGLAVAAASASLLTFFHPYDAGATDLVVHVVAIGLVIVLNRVFGGRLLSRSSGVVPSR